MKIRIKYLIIALNLFIFFVFVYLLIDPHRFRASLIRTKEVGNTENLYKSPELMSEYFQFENISELSQFRNFISNNLIKNDNDFITSVNILNFLGDYYYDNKVINKIKVPEYPDLILNELKYYKVRGTCYNDATLYITLVQSIGIKARYVSFLGRDGYGLNGHALTEIYSQKYKKWILIDPQQVAYFIDNKTKIPLSALEIRKYALELKEPEFYKNVIINQNKVGNVVKKEDIYDFYKLSVDIVFPNFNNYQSLVNNNIIYKISHYFSSKRITSGIIFNEELSRFLRSFFDKNRVNYRISDKYSPDIAYDCYYLMFHILFIIWILGFIYLIVIRLLK
ncbi:MAG: transglutaminase-like domain-containing protein [Bacteroidota bacterium]|nr:transglutaminase-like domain-containing protein [Bacteroidota bacterium]